MALEPDVDPVQRARDLARTSQPEGWVELSSAIRGRIRSLVPTGEPILVRGVAGGDGSTFVSSRVVIAALRPLLQGAPTHAPERIELDVDGDRLRAIELELVCAYGTPIGPLAERVRADVVGLLRELLGPDAELVDVVVDVHVSDVVEGDPNRV